MYELPYFSAAKSLGSIGITVRECCGVFIEDIEVDAINMGYGSMLLKNVISFFQRAGLRTLYGNISPVDSDHFDRLRHFYEKFGFDVKIRGTSGSISLNLQKHEFPTIEAENLVACCRGSGYSKMRSEYLLKNAREQHGE